HLKSETTMVRIAAATGLASRGQEDGLLWLIEQWQMVSDVPADGRDAECLLSSLVDCGRVEAIRALGRDLRKRSAAMRAEVILWVAGVYGVDEEPIRPAVSSAREDLLVEALGDTEQAVGVS